MFGDETRSPRLVPFRPQINKGQEVAYTAVAARTANALTHRKAHWVWATTHCWIATGDNTVVADTNDFPFPAGAVAEYTPRDATEDYISAVRITDDGSLFVGQSEEQ